MTTKALSSCRGCLGARLVAAGLTALVSGAVGSLAAAQSDAGALVDPRLYQDLRWRSVGPHRGGRVTAVAGHRAQPSTFYMGATGGGVWKTTDYGITWHPVSDGFFETGSIGAIEVAESDPNLVYVGTGSDGIRSNVIVGRGMYKSTDGGKTWTFIGLRNAGQIGAVKVHPRDPDLVYAAALGSPFGPNADRGVFRSRDGGKSWQKVLYASEKVGALALAMNPQEPAEIYAALWRGERKPWTIISGAPASDGPGIYRTRDGGETWTKLSKGLPQGLVGKIDLDVARSNPRRVYALIEAPGSERGLYRSDDSGETWQQVNGEFNLLRRPFYYTNVDADPKDPEVVYVSNEQFFKSTDGGRTFRRMGTPHGDNHGVWINPDHPEIFIQCNDGGANVTQDGGLTWSTQLNQPTGELYMVDVDSQFPYRLYAPQQDNSTLIAPSLPPVAWRLDAATQVWIHGPGCETGQIHPRPDGKVVYGVCKGEFGRYSVETGQEKHYWIYPQNRYGHNPRDMKYRFVRQSPLEVSPHDPKVVYHGSQYLHRTNDDGVTWQTISPDLTANEPSRQVISGEPITRDITGEEVHSALYAIEESRLEKGVIWTGSSDGPVHVTRDGGRTWNNVTPKDLPPDGRVMNIEDSPHRRGSAYIAVSRHLLDDFRPYIYATRDYGASWERLTDGNNGIPGDHPTRAMREDPAREGLLYAGTEFGVFVSFDGGMHWQTLQQNLPATPVTDIRAHRGDLVISTMGRAFWILDDVSPLRQLAATLAGGGAKTTGARLFLPREAYRQRYSASSGRPDVPEYPPAAARVDYVLEAPAEAELKLEILGPQGEAVRAFSSAAPTAAAPGERGAEEEEMGGPRSGPALPTRLPKKVGMNRFLWDLRHAGAWDRRNPEGGPGGPYVAPGRYQVRLSSGGWSQSQPLVVKMDPRVAADGVTQADLEEQGAFSLKVRDATSDARRLAERVREAREKAEGDGAASAKLQQLLDRLVTARGAYPQPMLIDQIGNVARMVAQADQRVGRDAYARLNDLMKELRALEAEAGKLVGAGASEGGLPAGRASAQFLDDFAGPSLPTDPDGIRGWSFLTGDGEATMDFRQGGEGHASIFVDATHDRRGIWWALIKHKVSDRMNLARLAQPGYELRIEARIRVSHAPRRVNLHLNTQRTTDFHSHLMEFDIPDTDGWHTISMTTRDFPAEPGDTVFGQLALIDWGLDKYRVDLDYLKVDVVDVALAGPDKGAAVPYHPPIPDLKMFAHEARVAQDAMIDLDNPDVNLNNWSVQEGAGRRNLLAVGGTQYVILRWDLGAFAGKQVADHGLLELTTHSVQRTSDDLKDFGIVRVVEILGGDPAWDQRTVTVNSLRRGQPLDRVLNTQMIIDYPVSEGDGAKTYLTISKPVLQRMIEGKTLGIAIKPLGSIVASFDSMENEGGRRGARLLFNVKE